MPNFTNEEIQEIKDNLTITLNNGVIQDGDREVSRHGQILQYDFVFNRDTTNAPVNETFDITDKCNERIWLEPNIPFTYNTDITFQPNLNYYINQPVGDILRSLFSNMNVRKITATQTITSGVDGFHIKPLQTLEFNRDKLLKDIEFKIGDSILDITDWLNLMLFINIERFEKEENNLERLLCNFTNMVDPNGDFVRDLQITISLKDEVLAIIQADKINPGRGDLINKVKRHYKSAGILDSKIIKTKVKASIPKPILPPDYSTSKEYGDILNIRSSSLRRQKLRQYTIQYIKNNLEKILVDNRINWNQFWNRFNGSRIQPIDPAKYTELIKNKVLKEANELQNIINTIHGNWDIRTKCDNNNKPCDYTGYRYRVTSVEGMYNCWIDSISISYFSTDIGLKDQTTITIYFYPTRTGEVDFFQDSEEGSKDNPTYMLKPYNSFDQSGPEANTYLCDAADLNNINAPCETKNGSSIVWAKIGGKRGAKDWAYRDDVVFADYEELAKGNSFLTVVKKEDYTPKITLDPDDPDKKLIIRENE